MVHVAASQTPGRRVALGLRRLTWLSGSAGMESQGLLLMYSPASAELGSQATLLSLVSRGHCLPRGIITGSGLEPTERRRGDVGREGPGGQNGTGPPGTEVRVGGWAGRAGTPETRWAEGRAEGGRRRLACRPAKPSCTPALSWPQGQPGPLRQRRPGQAERLLPDGLSPCRVPLPTPSGRLASAPM